ncbi:EAL domain-containing protein [Herbaspirillum sp. CF444]|uniref:EAL domain-containing protein n=1 Tax=Herbaspirillum sp. CF444 TaxID=1144319 RepID=UPI00027233B3|nr:EAL domain-containing protein [Herbaspirillum sp. CF444]EJL88732.1 EAL domain-containing protein [Herbaspirillum sp. CF444]
MNAITETNFIYAASRIERSQLLAALHDNQFHPYFQPIVCADGAWQGAEMLMRWHHPRHGVLPPAEFLTQLAEEGLLVAATRQILTKTRNTWREATLRLNRPFFLSFNACLAHLQSASLPKECRSFLKHMDDRQLGLMVEMPERGADLTADHCAALFCELGNAGATVAIDDFGIGDARLHQFACGPISCVKIDRSFVEQMESNPMYGRLIAKIVDLARAFGAHVTAEGVETVAQHRRLRRLGVGLFQGYLFGKPVAAPEFFTYLNASGALVSGDEPECQMATPNLK